EHYVAVKDHAHGTGTRKAAIELRNFIVNLINQGASRVVMDFQGIGVISSSFADELIGKLVVRFGFFNFQQIISLRGMTDTVQAILHRSVAQRMIEGLQQNQMNQEELND
ncbi:MAG TPA: STAS-like domain-containing protein, partial [Pyrinomonadaceae bacterium]|nr:STAS-like domain-containing protein [Pyrinomonadaceae bacterium]